MPLPLSGSNQQAGIQPHGGAPGGARPVLIHTGRSSGKTYRTPLDAHHLPDGYLFIPLYGPRTDWVKNVLAAQSARLSIDGHEIELESPRLVKKKDVWPLVPPTKKSYPGITDESELLRLTSADKA